jgi:hypothetical protein
MQQGEESNGLGTAFLLILPLPAPNIFTFSYLELESPIAHFTQHGPSLPITVHSILKVSVPTFLFPRNLSKFH